MFSFQNAWTRKRKAVYTFVLFHYIHSFPCENQIGSQLAYIIKLFKQAVRRVASGGKFYRLPPDKENSVSQLLS